MGEAPPQRFDDFLSPIPRFLPPLRVSTIMKFSTLTLSILCAAACVTAQNSTNTNVTRTAELLEGLQKAPTRLARLNVLQNNTDVSTSYRLLWQFKPHVDAVVIRLQFWPRNHKERRWKYHRR